ncbi:hypothetical protein DFH08DRAFT_914543 [Mycena albidolilacea]|uniref:Uncharacterized protein n=1 Tax=Mycena albidolilacea TaxID=1033008 RepID=A0AAD7A0C4_9AGAR|nr:hypothetical protein DFH08DRAFT_914543 [Mycena albidolilacea]
MTPANPSPPLHPLMSATPGTTSPPSQRKLDVPVREQVRLKKEKRAKDQHDALTAIEKVISLKCPEYQGPLQAKHAQVIQSTLHLVVRNSRSLIEASAMAAETHGFAAIWGSRLARKWTAEWVKHRKLPESEHGRHAKTWSLLQDPEIKEELVVYLRKMRKYVQTAVNKEMSCGLKKYLEVELFSCIGCKANNADKSKWVLKGEMPIRKKGVGHGIHRSDIICSTVGHINDTGESMEYGKHYEGYWDGAQFIKQGHCAYLEDVLVVNRMNWRSGGKQALMQDGWFMRAGQRILQKMVLPDRQPKGMKIVL